MIDDNIDTLYDGFDVDDFESELDAYETEVDNKVWIDSLIRDIDLD